MNQLEQEILNDFRALIKQALNQREETQQGDSGTEA